MRRLNLLNVKRPACLIALLVSLVVYTITRLTGVEASKSACSLDNHTITITAVIEEKSVKNNSLRLYLSDVCINEGVERINGINKDEQVAGLVREEKNDSIELRKVIAYLSDASLYSNLHMGQRVKVRGVFELYEPAMNEGQFDQRKYYAIRKIDGKISRARILGASREYNHIREGLRNIRDMAFNVLKNHMNEKDAGMLAAMTLGDKSVLDEDDKDLFQKVGLSHVLALSGLHIAIVGISLRKLLKKLRVPAILSSLLSGMVIILYGLMTGMSNSTIRAISMFLLAVVADMICRTYDLLSAAALSLVSILITNPYYIYDSGFLLSFGAVMAIGWVYPVIYSYINPELIYKECIKGKRKRAVKKVKEVKDTKKNRTINTDSGILKVVDKIWQSICVSVSITLVTLPVTASSYNQISKYSVFLNIIVIPLMSLVLATGFTGMTAGIIVEIISIKKMWPIDEIIGIPLKITTVILGLYRTLSLETAGFEGNLMIIGRAEAWQHILYVLLLIIAVIFGRYITKSRSVDQSGRDFKSNNARNVTKKYNKITGKSIFREKPTKARKYKIYSKIFKLIPVVIVGLAVFVLTYSGQGEVEIKSLYVGQGDCSLITGKKTPVILIDGGSTDRNEVGKYIILPVLKANGIDHVDYCFISHMDEDHVNGIFEILTDETCGVRIKNLIISRAMANSKECRDKLSQTNISKRTNIRIIEKGDSIEAGDIRITCMWPENSNEYAGNDSSLVLKLSYFDFDALFTGDISSASEEDMLKEYKFDETFLDIDYLKVAHHGSRFSTSDIFLRCTNPGLSVISSGIDNSYGHPHEETIERLKQASSKIYRTDQCGEIIFTLDQGRAHIKTFSNQINR